MFATPPLAPSVPEPVPTRRIPRAVITVFLGATLAWVLLFFGVLSSHRAAISDGLQICASATACVVLVRRPDGPSRLLGLAAGAWCATDVAWALASRTMTGTPDVLNLGYGLATVGYAIGVWTWTRTPRSDRTAGTPTVSVRIVTDGALLAGGVIACWLVGIWQPLAGGQLTLIAGFLSAADAAFVVVALLAWTRSTPAQRSRAALLALASLLLLVTDTAYFHVLFLASYAEGELLDVGWFSVSACLALAPFGPTRARQFLDRSRAAIWAHATVPPVVALFGLGLLVAQPRAWHPLLFDIWSWALVLALVVRQLLLFAEHLGLNERLRVAAADLAHRAEHDDLTGLVARRAFLEAADEALSDRRRDGGGLALLRVDIDAFRRINDTLGQAAGDQVLRVLARRLEAAAAPGDVVSRFGGAEFVVLRPDVAGDLDAWSEAVRSALAELVVVDGASLRLTCSIGLLESAGTHPDASQLLADVDLAMHDAKRGGSHEVHRYSLQLRNEAVGRSELAQLLRSAIECDALVVHYQPVFDLPSGRLVGCEALVRMDHPTLGLLPPGRFLPLASALGLTVDLTRVVLHRACRTFAADPSLGWVSVNLGVEDLEDPRTIERVAEALEASGLDPSRLVIEFSETVVPVPHLVRVAWRLEALGVRLALDDFGAGTSSLAQLRELPLHLVKLDRSMVELHPDDLAFRRALLATTMLLATSLDLDVIAEGIEVDAEAEAVRSSGVGLVQGHRWAAAGPIDQVRRTIEPVCWKVPT